MSLMKVDRQSRLPLHEQCRLQVLQWIQETGLRPGDRIPTERDLGEQLNVSRHTIREAINQLAQEGVVQRFQGRGTYVRKRAIPVDSHRLTSFARDMRSRGYRPSSVLLWSGLLHPGAEVLKALDTTAPTWCVKRLRFADDEPIGLNTLYTTREYAIPPRELEADPTLSISDLLLRRFKIELVGADERIRSRLATPEEVERLRLPPEVPILEIDRLSYDALGAPREFVQMCYRADRYDYVARIARRP